MEVARTFTLTSNDACYLEPAMGEGLALATQDARLSAAASAAGVAVLT